MTIDHARCHHNCDMHLALTHFYLLVVPCTIMIKKRVQFRWRNWRIDIVLAIVYFGVVSSLFPLCGVYPDYLNYDPTHNPLSFIVWLIAKVITLSLEILRTGRISLLFLFSLTTSLVLFTDDKLKTSTRVMWGLTHAFTHVAAAISCLVFVQTIAEWMIYEGIVKVNLTNAMPEALFLDSSKAAQQGHGGGVDGALDLAESLYDEYTNHFSHVFTNFTHVVNSNMTHVFHPEENTTAFSEDNQFGKHHNFFHAGNAYETLLTCWDWIRENVPLLKFTLAVFDLLGMIAQRHADICHILCDNGSIKCLLDQYRTTHRYYQYLDRVTVVTYLSGLFLYFCVFAIPLAGGVFGAWLALTLNVFKAQYNEGFSSLRIEHWKNFLKLHITKHGELEVFGIGLSRVPKRWMKDDEWDGSKEALQKRRKRASATMLSGSVSNANGNGTSRFCFSKKAETSDDLPSWMWNRPSQWVPILKSKKHIPKVIDYTKIAKRHHYGVNSNVQNSKGGEAHFRKKNFESVPNFRRTTDSY
mmetsp:Transcript_9644/g.11947  ORF Transcript_9644/g.11947 Transcript_9644/m.11947 type:complete len:526 (-) Transcript_9644:28-1605(-)